MASASAGSGSTATTSSAVRRLVASAITPSTAAPRPPKPIARPSVTPEAIPRRDGRYSWPMTTVTLKVAIVAAPIRASAPIATPTPPSSSTTMSGVKTAIDVRRTTRRPKRPASRPPAGEPGGDPAAGQRAERAGGEHRGERGVGGGLGGAQLVDEVERHERHQAEVEDRRPGAGGGRRRERAPLVGLGLRRGLVRRRGGGAEALEPPELAGDQQGDGGGHDGHERRAAKAEGQRERRHEHRAEREARVAADGEEAHRSRAPLAGHVVGEARCLRVV